jgi:uncharacterized repeat protein (TIGR01451 family)
MPRHADRARVCNNGCENALGRLAPHSLACLVWLGPRVIGRPCVSAVAKTGLFSALILLLASAASIAGTRQWTSATPAAGVPVRSSAQFRVAAVSTGGNVSIALFQLNADGTSTKLDTLTASTNAGAGSTPYVTQNMAAIYWTYASLPPAGAAPPTVSVTFYNDQPTVPLTSLYYPTPPLLPIAAGDASLLLDLDLRKGAPSGWTSTGSGTFDTTKGYTPGTAASAGVTNSAVAAFASAAALSQGSVAVTFQRTGVTIDDSFGTSFWDSTGATATPTNRELFSMQSSSGAWGFAAEVLGSAFPVFQVRLRTASMTSAYDTNWAYPNSHSVAGYQDATFATLLLTWYQNQYYLLFDGHLIGSGVLGDVPIYQMFQDICVGNATVNGVASGAPFGPFAIQRLQISRRFLGPVMAGPKLGLIPDSFAAAYTERGAPTATGAGGTLQISDVDAVQSALGLYTGIGALFGQPGQSGVFHQIQALMYQTYGFYPPIYNAGHPGHGYTLAPMDDAYIAALNISQPTIVLAGGTVNDVSPFTPADGTLVADTEGFMNRLTRGGGTRIAAAANPLLEQILYLETLSSQALPSAGGYPEPAYGNESQNVIALTRAQLPSFKPANGVSFQYLTSREWWNEASAYTTFLYGSAPADRYNGVGGKDYLNPHPDASGYSVIAANVYAPVRDAILNSAGADLGIQSTPLVMSGTTETFSLTLSNAGPLNAAKLTVTAVVPAGVTLVSSASASGCTQTGTTVTCRVSTLAAGAQTTLALAFQTASTTATPLKFAVGDGNGIDATSSNNTVSVVAPPATTPVSLAE